MGIDHSNPYIYSTTVLCDEKHNYYAIYLIAYMSLILQKESRTQPYTVRTVS